MKMQSDDPATLSLPAGIRIVMLGCGSIGQGLLPLLFRTFPIDPSQLTIITADDKGAEVAARFGVRYLVDPVTPENCLILLSQHLKAGDLLLNLSVGVSSLAMIAWCKEQGVLYLDTCVEPWQGGYVDQTGTSIETSNAWLRQQALSLHTPGAPTAVIAHGMNPGLISHLLKEALLTLARDKGIAVEPGRPLNTLAQRLGVRVVHLTERDTQDDGRMLAAGTFANTWSALGFYSEGYLQGAEIGWGTHEPKELRGGKLVACGSSKILRLGGNGAATFLKSWTPSIGEQQGMLVTHHEVISIAELLCTESYRPTVCYVYNVCPKARESLANAYLGKPIRDFQVLPGDMLHGLDEVGVLLFHSTGALWHGATLTSDEARALAPHNSATTLQVVAGVIGALAWMLKNPREGVVEAERMDSAKVLETARPYLGRVATFETTWRPGVHLDFGEFMVRASSYSAGLEHGVTRDCTEEAFA